MISPAEILRLSGNIQHRVSRLDICPHVLAAELSQQGAEFGHRQLGAADVHRPHQQNARRHTGTSTSSSPISTASHRPLVVSESQARKGSISASPNGSSKVTCAP